MFTWAIIDDARDRHTAPGTARRSRLASGPGGLQQNVKLFLREPLGFAPGGNRMTRHRVPEAEYLMSMPFRRAPPPRAPSRAPLRIRNLAALLLAGITLMLG